MGQVAGEGWGGAGASAGVGEANFQQGDREEGKLLQAWVGGRGLSTPRFSPLGPALGVQGLEGQGQATTTTVPLGKVNPVALATCPAIPAHCVLLLSPHVRGEGTRGTLTVLPERSADRQTHPPPPSPAVAGRYLKPFRWGWASSLPPSPVPTHHQASTILSECVCVCVCVRVCGPG